MNVLLIMLILVLSFSGYQLYVRNKMKKQEMIEREQTQKDELLKKKFPHIFLEYQDSIREFWRGIKEKEKYYHESSHSAIGYPEFGEEVD